MLKPGNSFQKSIKTESDIKEDILKDSHDSSKNKSNVAEKGNEVSQFLPQSVISSVKLARLKEQKDKLNQSFKVPSQTENTFTSNKLNSNSLSKTQKSHMTPKANNLSKPNHLILPRISSATNIRNKSFIMKPTNATSNKKINKRTNLIPFTKPQRLYIHTSKNASPEKNHEEDLKLLEKENLELISELHSLNKELTNLLDKKTRQREKERQIQTPESIETEKILNKKYLMCLINEYNNLYRIYSNSDQDQKDILENKLEILLKEYKDNKMMNSELKKKIIKNENYLKDSDKEQVNYFKNIDYLHSKYDLYKIKIMKEKKEIERMKNVIQCEREKLDSLNEKYSKMREILHYYDETPKSMGFKVDKDKINKKNEETYKNLMKKKKIISHSRISMKKNYAIEIDKQKKYIEQLQSTIIEVNAVLDSLKG